MSGEDVTSEAPPSLTVATREPSVTVVSRWTLVAQAVAAGLEGRIGRAEAVGLDAFTHGVAAHRAGHLPDDVVILLLQEPADRGAVNDALALVRRLPARWVVLTGEDTVDTWGGFVEAGARWVGRATTPLDDLARVLDDVVAGTALDDAEAEALVACWRSRLAEEERLLAQMLRLTPRERTVLRLLYDGDNVRAIADALEVSEATVRSQVKSLLRRLDVNSQLAAIAAYQRLRDAELPLPVELSSA